DAVSRHTAVVERGRLTGPGAADIAPRGATVVDRGVRSSVYDSTRPDDRGSFTPVITSRAPRDQSARPTISGQPSRPQGSDSWRSRTDTQVQRRSGSDRGAPQVRESRPANSNQARADAWRQSNRPAPQER